MKVLIAVSGWGSGRDLYTISGIRHVQTYYLSRWLNELGAEVVYCRVGPAVMDYDESLDFYSKLEVPEADHCLCLEPRGFHARTFQAKDVNVVSGPVPVWRRMGISPFLSAIRRKVPGCVSTLCDMPRALGMEDITFYGIRHPADFPLADRTVELGWAADGSVLVPRQEEGKTRVLLDHGHYNHKEDDSDMLLKSLEPWKDWVTVARFSPHGVEEVDLNSWTPVDQRHPSASYFQATQAHNRSHVFCVTHQESLGLSTLEAAMAGNLVVCRKGFIKSVLLDKMRHVEYEEKPDWKEIFAAIDVDACRQKVKPFDRWMEMAQIVYDQFSKWV